MDSHELSDEELDCVSGGTIWETIVAAAKAVGSALGSLGAGAGSGSGSGMGSGSASGVAPKSTWL